MRPFIYLCTMPRSGGTVLAEALTNWPKCFIHNEPFLSEDDLRWTGIGLLPEAQWHRLKHVARYAAQHRPSAVHDYYRNHFMAKLPEVEQFGIKEISHGDWPSIFQSFGDVRTIVTCRDPRDICASLLHMRKFYDGPWVWNKPVHELADMIRLQFIYQQAIMKSSDYLLVRYEDLCTNPQRVLLNVFRYVERADNQIGDIGCFTDSNSRRHWEAVFHLNSISTASIGRWKRMKEHREQINVFFELTKEYAEFFGYE